MKISESKIYYSLDIETSGFDPESNEILEVGYVGFKIEDGGCKIVEKWSKVFKPKAEVSHHILGLTGLKTADLEKGGALKDELFFLQGKLGSSPIVGHNVGFDVKFLERNGLKFSGPQIDTMDLVQFLLPTHHSYNLENLTHIFKISHKNAHRALADALASMELLERLLGVYQNLPEQTKAQIVRLAGQANAPWADLLLTKIKPYKLSLGKALKKPLAIKNRKVPLGLKHQTIYTADALASAEEIVSEVIRNTSENLLIVVPKRHLVLELWRKKIVRGIFEPRHMLDAEKLAALLNQQPKSPEQARFLMKLLIWQATNWQAECLLDLNLSFFGGQFKDLVSGNNLPQSLSDRVLCCDQQAFLQLQGSSLFSQRSLVIISLGDFEAAVTATIGTRNSWGFVSYLLKSVYDPETGFGKPEHKDAVSRLLTDADLFFGLTNALLLKFNKGWGEVSLTDWLRNSEEFVKITQAAENFIEKLSSANRQLALPELDNFCRGLGNFFTDDPHEVKWISFGEHTCSFHSLPLDISGVVKKSFSGFAKVSVVESRGEKIVLDYFVNRLGLGDFLIADWPRLSGKFPSLLTIRPVCKIIPEDKFKPKDFFGKKNLPAVMVFNSPADIAQIYKQNYSDFQKAAFLLAERSSGTNKLFRNFGIHNNSLLLVSGKTVLGFLRTSQQVQPVAEVAAKNLVFAQWPDSRPIDPYSQALAGQYPDPEKKFFLPKSLYDLEVMLRFFYTNKLKQIIILKSKKAFKYEELYKDYLKSLYKVKEEK